MLCYLHINRRYSRLDLLPYVPAPYTCRRLFACTYPHSLWPAQHPGSSNLNDSIGVARVGFCLSFDSGQCSPSSIAATHQITADKSIHYPCKLPAHIISTSKTKRSQEQVSPDHMTTNLFTCPIREANSPSLRALELVELIDSFDEMLNRPYESMEANYLLLLDSSRKKRACLTTNAVAP